MSEIRHLVVEEGAFPHFYSDSGFSYGNKYFFQVTYLFLDGFLIDSNVIDIIKTGIPLELL